MILPQSFADRMVRLTGAEADSFFSSLEQDSAVSIRINREKIATVPAFKPVLWCETGVYLPERLHFTFDPLFHAGAYYVQEASSMFLEQVIRKYVKGPVCCLDLCAAPGGKSTHLLSLLPQGSLLVSNEVIRNRCSVLAENVSKWGNPDVIVTNNDPESIGQLTHLFDVIVADVPCSGEGMFRKDPDSIGEWSDANVELCASRQRRIIHDVWDSLAPGGLLIYSTCTYNTRENEENVAYIAEQLGAEVLPVECSGGWGVSGALLGDHPVYRFFPHKVEGEGFFIAVIRKPEGEREMVLPKNRKKKQRKKGEDVPENVKQFLVNPDRFVFDLSPKGYRAFSAVYEDVYRFIKEKLHTVSSGILLGEVKGKDFVPSQSLAVSCYLNTPAFNRWELDWAEAVKYLRKEPLTPLLELPKGLLLVSYRDVPLGFIKNLGNRTNNLYPNEWRIRSAYVPEVPRILF